MVFGILCGAIEKFSATKLCVQHRYTQTLLSHLKAFRINLAFIFPYIKIAILISIERFHMFENFTVIQFSLDKYSKIRIHIEIHRKKIAIYYIGWTTWLFKYNYERLAFIYQKSNHLMLDICKKSNICST